MHGELGVMAPGASPGVKEADGTSVNTSCGHSHLVSHTFQSDFFLAPHTILNGLTNVITPKLNHFSPVGSDGK